MTPAGERERAAVKNWLKERGATFQFTTWIVEPGQKYDQGEYISTEEAMVRYAEAARREERKRCAEIADNWRVGWDNSHRRNIPGDFVASEIAQAIRALEER